MPKRIAPLTDVKIRTAKPSGKDAKSFDGGGLYMLVTPTGGKLWYLKYRFDGKEKKLSLGAYPEVSLGDARLKREEARRQVAQGIDPGAVKKALKASLVQQAETFEAIAREWHERFLSTWPPGHAATIMDRLTRDVFPWIGARPISELKAHEVLELLRRVESRGALETAHRIRTICGQVCRYAVSTSRLERDPTVDLKGALPPTWTLDKIGCPAR